MTHDALTVSEAGDSTVVVDPLLDPSLAGDWCKTRQACENQAELLGEQIKDSLAYYEALERERSLRTRKSSKKPR